MSRSNSILILTKLQLVFSSIFLYDSSSPPKPKSAQRSCPIVKWPPEGLDWRFFTWPEGMSYLEWKKLENRILCIIMGRSEKKPSKKRKKNKKVPRRIRLLNRKLMRMQAKLIQESLEQLVAETIEGSDEKEEPTKEVKIELISMLKLFLGRKRISENIEKTIPDHRNQDFITYSKQSIIMAALVMFLLRMSSGNSYDKKSHDEDEKYSRKNIAKFIDAPEDRTPVIKTIENFIKKLKEEHVNRLMLDFFKDLQKSKFFRQHPQIMPGDVFLLAADCVHTHTYDHPHHTDKDGNNDCEYCLERVYNRGTENEQTKWIHCTLVFCFVFIGGLKIPIYQRPIRAEQVANLESASEDKHKQECELTALKDTLPLIRQEFPKMKIVLLLDGLYANRPVIRLLDDLRCEYIIVRKEKCLKTLGTDCDGLAKDKNHKKNCVKKYTTPSNPEISRTYEWFNGMDIGDNNGDLKTNVIRFTESRTTDKGTKIYKCEWLCSCRISANNCELLVEQARARWQEEDLFNTLKNRGFNLGHDYSRNPRSFFIWQGLALFAFGIFELFRFSEAVKQTGDLPQITLARKLEGQLLHRPTEEILSSDQLSRRIQFRYNFVISPIRGPRIRPGPDPGALEAA